MTEALLIFLFSTFILITAAIVVYIYSAITQKDIVSKEKLREYKDKFINNLKSRYVFYGVVITIFLLIIYYGINIFSAQIREISYKPPSPPAPISAETLKMYNFVESAIFSTVLFLVLLTPVIISFANFRKPVYKLFLPEATFLVALLTTVLCSGGVGILLVFFAPLSIVLFPTGLLALQTQISGDYYNDSLSLIIWGVYLLIIVISKFIRNRIWYIFLYIILLFMLSANIAGCSISIPDMLSNIN